MSRRNQPEAAVVPTTTAPVSTADDQQTADGYKTLPPITTGAASNPNAAVPFTMPATDNGTPKKQPRKMKRAIRAMHTIGGILDELESMDRAKVMLYLVSEYGPGEGFDPE